MDLQQHVSEWFPNFDSFYPSNSFLNLGTGIDWILETSGISAPLHV